MRITALICCVFIANSALAQQDQSVLPPGPPPVFSTVGGVDKEKGTILLTENRPVEVKYQEKIVVVFNGMEVEKVVERVRTEYVPAVKTCDAAKCRIMTADGKQVRIDEVWKRLKPKAIVVVSFDGKAPAEEYLQALHPSTFVFVLPPTDQHPPIPEPKKIDG